ncbi:putative peptidoglycan-binding domain-containing protein [Terriglobus albidus]|uniref:putative peptidoglycan-binding domain-containing protein n=1 Tax=Terriglobus albidus TaxID=1592106 RepID=UPI0021E009E8|nr:putative peptidoglycan-binding domain-containing protein [Terriglobus albidus]
MANVQAAIEFVLKQEDEKLSGIVTKANADKGGMTRFGISAKYHPDLVRAGFYQCHRDEALGTAIEVYRKEYAEPIMLDKVWSDVMACAMLSFSILENCPPAIMRLQESLNELGSMLKTDGSMGPKTLAALNAASPSKLLPLYVERNRQFLIGITVSDPTQLKWKNGWLNRCNKVLKLIERPTVQ